MTTSRKSNITAFLLLFGIIIAIYSNTLNASWHLDDYHSIINNPKIHLNDLSYKQLKRSLFAAPAHGSYDSPNLYRPVTNLTFALNWFFGSKNVVGYHIVNTLIHITTAFFLFLVVQVFLKTPTLSPFCRKHAYAIALLASALWAINGVQTQAITYIVQRMASLAAMFYIICIYCYSKGRVNTKSRNKILFFLLCAISALLAIGSKENAAMIPGTLLLVETIFFQKNRPFHLRLVFCILTLAFLFLLVLYFNGSIDHFLTGYQDRPFSLQQRLLTESRIIIFYLSLLFFPTANRLSISHDLEISTSLLSPWTTLPSIICISLLILGALIRLRKNPLLSFSILFYFLNHIIESSVIPLELIFEHRNYLPSMFIFLPVAYAIVKLTQIYRKDIIMNNAIFFICTFLFIIIGFNAYKRNITWETEDSLWHDAAIKAPLSARPIQNLAAMYFLKGNYTFALALYQKAIKSYNSQDIPYFLGRIHHGIALTYFTQGKFSKAEEECLKTLNICPEYIRVRMLLCLIYLQQGHLEKADKTADFLIKDSPNNSKTQRLKGITSLRREKYKLAIQSFLKVLELRPNDIDANIGMGKALDKEGKYGLAEQFLFNALKDNKKDIRIYLSLAEGNLMKTKEERNNFYLDELFKVFSFDEIKTSLDRFSKNKADVYSPNKNLQPAIKIYMDERLQQWISNN